MKIASFSIADYCEATEGMPHDVERLYFRMIMKMLSREGGLPDDDAENARMFGYKDVRTYKALKNKLLKWPDTIFIDGGLIRNRRVEKDLVDVRERRAQAARSGQIGGRSNRDRSKIAARSDEDRPEIDPRSSGDREADPAENNDLPEASPSPSPTPSPEEKTDTKPASVETVAEGGELAGLNGSAEPMLRDVIGWMVGGNEKSARQWLTTQVQLYGQNVTKDAYAKLTTEIAEGGVIARPLQTWSTIAARMRDRPSQPKRGDDLPPWKRDQARRNAEARAWMDQHYGKPKETVQ